MTELSTAPCWRVANYRILRALALEGFSHLLDRFCFSPASTYVASGGHQAMQTYAGGAANVAFCAGVRAYVHEGVTGAESHGVPRTGGLGRAREGLGSCYLR